MFDYDKIRAWRSGEVCHTYTARDTMLYALSLGVGSNPLNTQDLRYVYEKELVALPTMAAVLASPGAWMRERTDFGIDFLRLVHGEQSVRIHRPLPAAGTVVGESCVTRIVDKGEGKGAVMHIEKTLKNRADGNLLATSEQVLFLRGNGGFSRGKGGDTPAAASPSAPDTEPDVVVNIPTRPEAALLYRLNGDANPLHVDSKVAAEAGFSKPILHGLATWGCAGRAVVQWLCEDDVNRLQGIRARMVSPVYPGETLVFQGWRMSRGQSSDEIAFQVRVKERGQLVLSHGQAHAAV